MKDKDDFDEAGLEVLIKPRALFEAIATNLKIKYTEGKFPETIKFNMWLTQAVMRQVAGALAEMSQDIHLVAMFSKLTGLSKHIKTDSPQVLDEVAGEMAREMHCDCPESHANSKQDMREMLDELIRRPH